MMIFTKKLIIVHNRITTFVKAITSARLDDVDEPAKGSLNYSAKKALFIVGCHSHRLPLSYVWDSQKNFIQANRSVRMNNHNARKKIRTSM